MRKFLFLSLSAVVALALIGCGQSKDKGPFTGLISDSNCSLAADKKSNRIIGAFSDLAQKSKRIDITVNGKPETVYFTDATKWKYSKKIKEMNDLRKFKGHCVAFDYKKEGEKYIASNIIVTEDLVLDPKILLTYEQFKDQKDKAKIFDCRPGFKVAEGTIPGAIIMPPASISKSEEFEKVIASDKNAPIIFFCGGFT